MQKRLSFLSLLLIISSFGLTNIQAADTNPQNADDIIIDDEEVQDDRTRTHFPPQSTTPRASSSHFTLPRNTRTHDNPNLPEEADPKIYQKLAIQKLLTEINLAENTMFHKADDRALAREMFNDKKKAEAESKTFDHNVWLGTLQLGQALVPTVATQVLAPFAARGIQYLLTPAEIRELEAQKKYKEQLQKTIIESEGDEQLLQHNLRKDPDNTNLQKTFEELKKVRTKINEGHGRLSLSILQKENQQMEKQLSSLEDKTKETSNFKWKEEYWKPLAVTSSTALAVVGSYLAYKNCRK